MLIVIFFQEDKLLGGKRIVGHSVNLYVFIAWTEVFAKSNTVKKTVISPNFLVWKLRGKAQFP